jgi:UrcA family protein
VSHPARAAAVTGVGRPSPVASRSVILCCAAAGLTQIGRIADAQRRVKAHLVLVVELSGVLKMRPHTVKLTAIAAGLTIFSGASFAQQPAEVVVEAARPQVTHSSANGVPIDVITIRHRVSYKDIDISTTSGAEVLKQRIKDAAKEACKDIGKLYPNVFVSSGVAECEKAAIDDGMVQANTAIANARKTAGK